MRSLLTIFFSLILAFQGNSQKVQVRFSKNIDLFAYIVHLGDPAENDPSNNITKKINAYPEDGKNKALFQMFEVAQTLEYSFLIELMYRLQDLPSTGSLNVPSGLLKKYQLNAPDDQKKVEKLIGLANQLAQETNFHKIWESLSQERKKVRLDLIKMSPSDKIMAEMESFYGQEFQAYEIIPSLMLWTGSAFGLKNIEGTKATFVLAPLEPNYIFNNDRFESLTIHEFGHPFVNDVVAKNENLIAQTQTLFAPIQSAMQPQGYSNWLSCLYEHFVRAGEVIIPKVQGDLARSSAIQENYTKNRSFKYLPFIVDRLQEYRFTKKFSYQESVEKTMIDLKDKYVNNSNGDGKN
ncbi:DUF4932 domain-containing protein [Roseivirga misakiensis]|uniref:DUF4932 domain-containing protein n=1 Tax=Roseivirga misakiensis TaxID=1563681 RepID=A0A1E5SZ63_9BACT|nr:DUF4932 domain-containing protein [Roseivirga misakiensis]OEK04400.1 hypothetical protein BFP71_13040 [Roseivirga misakiensis]